MKPANLTSTLHIVAKPACKDTRSLRYIEPQQGIIWETVASVFVRNGWQLQEETSLFIKAYHETSHQMVIISKMSSGQVLIHHQGEIFGSSALHELENIAELQFSQPEPTPQLVKRFSFSDLVSGLRQFIG
jgi:hypothetical protein